MRTPTIAAIEAVLLAPAVLFLTAVRVRELKVLPAAVILLAERVVALYAGRVWTLWVLLLALPLLVLATGGAMLFCVPGHSVAADALVPMIKARSKATEFFLGATTVTAGAIVAIVVLHMLAN